MMNQLSFIVRIWKLKSSYLTYSPGSLIRFILQIMVLMIACFFLIPHLFVNKHQIIVGLIIFRVNEQSIMERRKGQVKVF